MMVNRLYCASVLCNYTVANHIKTHCQCHLRSNSLFLHYSVIMCDFATFILYDTLLFNFSIATNI